MNQAMILDNATTNSSWKSLAKSQKRVEEDPLFWVMVLLVSFVFSVGMGVFFVKPAQRSTQQVPDEVYLHYLKRIATTDSFQMLSLAGKSPYNNASTT
jgi:hypothetical protein